MKESRRSFLKKTAAVGAVTAANGLLPVYGASKGGSVVVVPDPEDPVTKEPPVQWAMQQLVETLKARSVQATVLSTFAEAASSDDCIVVGSRSSKFARQLLNAADLSTLNAAESLALVRGILAKGSVLLVSGVDARGLAYALLELADRAQLAPEPLADFKGIKRIVQKPANQIRCISRIFASDVEDKSWFNDRSLWQEYLTLLATHRFNRFSLNLGLGYDFTTDITDAYFHFAYPFLLSVPGYSVRAVSLPDAERDRNLEMLRFISEETVRRGMHFQLGIWTHAYKWTNSPNANYVIEGLTAESHAPYCREALTMLLKQCPAIGGVTLRIHGESGVAEGSYEFWKEIFQGAAGSGRKVQIDLHAKGIDQKMIDLALDSGMPVTVAPKFWAEHMGLGYMQGAIRPLEMPPREENDKGFFSKSNGSRRFLRYGYGDLLAEDRRYGVLHRIWPGTQRLLQWGDPEMAAAYGRASSFCGSLGVDWFEPLSFKGRKGSGLSGGRNAYADDALRPKFDFEKFAYSYRVWGRRIYDPDCAPDEWRRYLTAKFGPAASSMESSLAHASRILPLVTTAHCPSAANNNYWPEMYTNMPIVSARRPHPYGDTPSPKRFGTVSPLDPEFFLTVQEYATNLVQKKTSSKFTPVEVAAFLEILAEEARSSLRQAQSKSRKADGPEFRRAAADIEIMCGLGVFFAAKFRVATLFAVYEKTDDLRLLEKALIIYETARSDWAKFASAARPTYREDVTFGPGKFQRGHWLDRLSAIDNDLADMKDIISQKRASSTPNSGAMNPEALDALLKVILGSSHLFSGATPEFSHTRPATFRRAEDLPIEALSKAKAATSRTVILHYRQVNQVESWQAIPMVGHSKVYRASIPAAYTDSPFPLQYYFEVSDDGERATLFPGLDLVPKGQPYFVVISRA